MSKKSDHPKDDEKKHGLIDRLLHGDHGHASESEEAEVSGDQDSENDVPKSKPSKKSSDGAGAASDMSAHPKFAKFKKGN